MLLGLWLSLVPMAVPDVAASRESAIVRLDDHTRDVLRTFLVTQEGIAIAGAGSSGMPPTARERCERAAVALDGVLKSLGGPSRAEVAGFVQQAVKTRHLPDLAALPPVEWLRLTQGLDQAERAAKQAFAGRTLATVAGAIAELRAALDEVKPVQLEKPATGGP